MSILLKLSSLAIRTIAKPIGNLLKLQAKQHPTFRRGCVALAQNLHQIDVKLKIKLLGQQNIKIRPLNETRAIENGATIISETFIFGVAGALIFYESYRQRRKELVRRELVADDISILQDEIEFLKKNLSEYVKIEDYKPRKEYHPVVLKIDETQELEHMSDERKFNLILMLKLGEEELKFLSDKTVLKTVDKKLGQGDDGAVMYLKLEKIDK